MENEWVNIKETNRYPDEGRLVWFCNTNLGFVWLGYYTYVKNEGWFWSESNGILYSKNGRIETDAVIDDDYIVTDWCYAPEMPKINPYFHP